MSPTPETPPATDTPNAAEEAQRRIAKLEQRCRGMGLLAWLGFSFGTFAVLVLVLQRIGERGGPVHAQAFVIEDFSGRPRASLDLLGGEDEVRLQLNDLQGRSRFLATVGGSGMPQIQLRDERGRVRLGMGILPDGAPMLVLTGADTLPRVSLRTEGSGDGGRVVVRQGDSGEDYIIPPARDGR